MKITGSQTHDPGPVQQLAAQPLLVSVTLGKALAAEVTPCAAGCGAVSGHPISAGYNGPVSSARCGDCANLRWRAGRFRRHVAGGMPLSDSVAVVASRETDRPSPSCAADAAQETLVVCYLYFGLFASASADATGQSHRGVRPPCIRIAAAAVRGRYEVIFASRNCSVKQRGMRYQSILLMS